MTTSIAHDVYALIDYENASPEVQEIYDETKTQLGLPFVLNWFKCQGNNAVLLRANWEKLRNTLLVGEVPVLLKQLIIYNVSKQRGCNYCQRAHGIFSNLMGKSLSDDKNFKAAESLYSPPVPAAYSTAVKVITKAALNHANITGEDFDELMDAGFSSSEIRELMAQADLVNMLNTIADITGIKIDNELLEIEA